MGDAEIEAALHATIVGTLRDHPEMLRTALDAVHIGAQAAIKRLIEEVSTQRVAVSATLCLVNEKRLTKETVAGLNEVVCRSFPKNAAHQNGAEQQFLERVSK